jgi:hypothetical protein
MHCQDHAIDGGLVVRWILWSASGVGLLIVGAVVVFTTNSAADFGWYAYSPGNRLEMTGNFVLLSRIQVIGLCLGVLGLVVLASGAGYLAGQRRRG